MLLASCAPLSPASRSEFALGRVDQALDSIVTETRQVAPRTEVIRRTATGAKTDVATAQGQFETVQAQYTKTINSTSYRLGHLILTWLWVILGSYAALWMAYIAFTAFAPANLIGRIIGEVVPATGTAATLGGKIASLLGS